MLSGFAPQVFSKGSVPFSLEDPSHQSAVKDRF